MFEFKVKVSIYLTRERNSLAFSSRPLFLELYIFVKKVNRQFFLLISLIPHFLLGNISV